MDVVGILTDQSTLGPLNLTLRVLAVSGSINLFLGLALGTYLSRSQSRLKNVVDFLVTIPMVFPPIATGFVLLLLLGRTSLIGSISLVIFGVLKKLSAL